MDSRNSTPQAGQLATIVERNIQALLNERKVQEDRLSWSERVAQRITDFSGSMRFVFLHAFLFGTWVLVNLPWFPPVVPKFDPTYVVLAMFASVEAIFLSTFILITQNRMMKLADRRADLNLQINLLAEHEVTRLIQMNTALCERLGLRLEQHPDLAELTQEVRPEQVLDTIERHERHADHET